MEKDIRILLVDDHPAVCEGLQHMLEQEEDMEVVGQSANGEDALLQAERLCPNIALVDIKMPGMGGIELTRQLKEKFPSCRVIMLSLYDEYLAEAMEAGASGYLLKDIKRKELAQTIRDVHLGQVVISGGIPASTRFEYERRLQNKSAGNEIFEEIQLVIPPSIDAKQVMEFIQRVDEVLQSRLIQTVGSWQKGTAITVSLNKAGSLADILNKLREMPEVEEVEIEERLPANQNLLGLLKKVAGISRISTKTILVTLKQG